MSKIVGVSESSGEFQGRAFSGLRLHLTGEKKNTIGVTAENIYLKMENAKNLLEHAGGVLENLIDLNVNVFYDQYKKPSHIEILGL